MKNAVEELREIHKCGASEDYISVRVSFDGSYQTRSGKSGGGFSRFCFGAAISTETGKVLQYDIGCNSCRKCTEYTNLLRNEAITFEEYEEWKENHQYFCTANLEDYASVQLESQIAPNVVQKALELGVIFSGIVTDGDNKTHEVLRKSKPYQHLGIYEIERLECLAHVAKRLKKNICNYQEKSLKSHRNEKEFDRRLLSKGSMSKGEITKSLNTKYFKMTKRDSGKRDQDSWGKGKSREIKTISDAMAGQIASYYKQAVKRNIGDIDAIIKAIQAIPLHLSANDTNAAQNHRLCPKSATTWCPYQASIWNAQTPGHHPNYIGNEAFQLVMKVFDEFGLSTPNFVEKIQQGLTSNHNEALHRVLWSMVLKNEFASSEMMELGSALAVIRYNDGFGGLKQIFDLLRIPMSRRTSEFFLKADTRRITESSKDPSKMQKRFSKKQMRQKKTSKQLKKHGDGYSSGKYSAASHNPNSSNSDQEPELEPSSKSYTCATCGGDQHYVAGLGIGRRGAIPMIQCGRCLDWNHEECVCADQDSFHEEWICPNCV